MNNTSLIKANTDSSNPIQAQKTGDYFEILRDAIANGEYPTPATVDAAIDAILPIILGDHLPTRSVA